jgi:predicted kinase
MMNYKRLILVRGISGSGKSTFCMSVWHSETSAWFEADHYFYNEDGEYNFDASKLNEAHTACQDGVRKAMTQEQEIIYVSNTFTTEEELEPYFEMAKEYDYNVTSLIIENRNNTKSVHDVPEATLQKQEQRLRGSIKLR